MRRIVAAIFFFVMSACLWAQATTYPIYSYDQSRPGSGLRAINGATLATSASDTTLTVKDAVIQNLHAGTTGLTSGTLSVQSPLAISNTTRQLIGGAARISIPNANAGTTGSLRGQDWTIFNNKQPSIWQAGTTGTLSVLAGPLSLSGNPIILGPSRTISHSVSDIAAGRYGSATVMPLVTYDTYGHATGVTSTTITGTAPGGAAGGNLAGTYPNPTFSTAAFGNPTATVNGTATNGTGLVAMRNDASPPLADPFTPADGTQNITGGLAVSGTATFGTYTGQSSIVTLGTVGTGTWQATKIGLLYGGTNTDLSATGGTHKFLSQASSGSNITVVQPDFSDLATSISLGQIPNLLITNGKLANSSITIGGASTSLGGTVTATTILDSIGSTRGSLLERGASIWGAITPGTSGLPLLSQGTGADPTYTALSLAGAAVTGTLPGTKGGNDNSTAAVGDLLYASATTPVWSRLADVAAGSYFRSGGTSTAPLWSTLILPNSATAQRVVFATGTNTWGDSSVLTFDSAVLSSGGFAAGTSGITITKSNASFKMTPVTSAGYDEIYFQSAAGTLKADILSGDAGTVGGASGGGLAFYTGGNTTTPTMLMDSSNNVSIGSTTATSKFNVGTAQQFQVGSTGLVLAPDGTAGGPAYSFTGDTNTGLYRVGADDLALSVGGTAAYELATTTETLTGVNTKYATIGKGLQFKSGTNGVMGNATLSGGTVTVSNTAVRTGDLILFGFSSGTNAGTTSYTITDLTSFVVTSSNNLDARSFVYLLIHQGS